MNLLSFSDLKRIGEEKEKERGEELKREGLGKCKKKGKKLRRKEKSY